MKTQGQRNMRCLIKLPRVRSGLKDFKARHSVVRLIMEPEFLWAICSGALWMYNILLKPCYGVFQGADYYVSRITWIIAK